MGGMLYWETCGFAIVLTNASTSSRGVRVGYDVICIEWVAVKSRVGHLVQNKLAGYLKH